MALRLNLFVKLHPHAERMRKRQRKLKPVRPSHKNELWYKAELLKIVKLLRASSERHLLPALQLYIAAGDSAIAVDAAPAFRFHAPPPPVTDAFGAMSREFGGIDQVAQRLATLAVKRNLEEVDQRLIANIKQAVGVDISSVFANDLEVRQAMDGALRDNVGLITSIPEKYFAQLREVVQDNFVEGVRWEDMVDAVQHIGDVTESRAKLIARDQTSKMNSALNRERQTSVGIERYGWMTAGDERVRESHAELDGQVFRWDHPPIVDGEPANPGEPIQCRCTAIPMFDLDEEDEAGQNNAS